MGVPTFITLGPEGTCHENALLHYLDFQGLVDFQVVLVEDLLGEGVGRVRGSQSTFLVQCSAHTQVHLVTERYHGEVFVVDSFLFPTKPLGLLARKNTKEPESLGIVAATRGYTDLTRFRTLVDEPSKPVVGRHLLEGRYDAGLTHLHYAHEHPHQLEILETYGPIDTTWIVYGPTKRLNGQIIGQKTPWLYTNKPQPADHLEPRGGMPVGRAI